MDGVKTIPGVWIAHCKDCATELTLTTEPAAMILVKRSCYVCAAKIVWHPAPQPPTDDEPKPTTEYFGDDPRQNGEEPDD